MKNNLDTSKRGQVTIFIIVAVVAVAIVLLVVLLIGNRTPNTSGGQKEDINGFLTACIRESIAEGIYLIETQGGYVNPFEQEHLDFQFNNEPKTTIAYLCYYQGDYLPCVSQEPLLIEHLEQEIKDYIESDVEFCFDDLTASLENQGYVVSVRYREGDFSVELQEGRVLVNVNAEISLTKAEESSTESGFRIGVPSEIYGMSTLSQRIINSEVLNCDFNTAEYAELYSDYDINRVKTTNSVKIYTIKNKESNEMFRFAVRGCVNPPGY